MLSSQAHTLNVSHQSKCYIFRHLTFFGMFYVTISGNERKKDLDAFE